MGEVVGPEQQAASRADREVADIVAQGIGIGLRHADRERAGDRDDRVGGSTVIESHGLGPFRFGPGNPPEAGRGLGRGSRQAQSIGCRKRMRRAGVYYTVGGSIGVLVVYQGIDGDAHFE